MDAFFASVEQRDRPELRGKAVIVGGDGRRGVVAAASYEARRYGVQLGHAGRSGTPAVSARRVRATASCPLPRGLGADIRDLCRLLGTGRGPESRRGVHRHDRGRAQTKMSRPGAPPQTRISVELNLTASIGIGNSKLVAKLASAYDKPDGLTWVRPAQVQQFLDPLPVRRLPGVGPSTGSRLQDAGHSHDRTVAPGAAGLAGARYSDVRRAPFASARRASTSAR